MAGVEELQEYGTTFLFEDGTKPSYINSAINRVVHDRYEGVDDSSLVAGEMGGTTHLVFFDAEGKRPQASFFDSSPKEKVARLLALFHLANEY